MVGITEIAAGMTSLKTIREMVQAINGMQAGADLNAAKIQLQSLILEAQQSLFAAQEAKAADTGTIANLEAEIVRLKDWSSERQKYELVDVDQGSLAYMLKAGMRGSEPPHWLCTNCFEKGVKSILQMQGEIKNTPHRTIGCPACRASMAVHYRRSPRWKETDEPAKVL